MAVLLHCLSTDTYTLTDLSKKAAVSCTRQDGQIHFQTAGDKQQQDEYKHNESLNNSVSESLHYGTAGCISVHTVFCH